VSVRIELGPGYQEYADNREVVMVEGGTVRECLAGLIATFPVFHDLLYGDAYSLSALVIYRDELIVPDQLDRPVEDGDEISLLPIIYGG
jgi:hypothetical protein